jgi:hypothetical protein
MRSTPLSALPEVVRRSVTVSHVMHIDGKGGAAMFLTFVETAIWNATGRWGSPS